MNRVPVNKTAALVTGRGVHYTPKKKIQTADQITPIPTRPVRHGVDLSGTRQGRLTVIGLAHRVKGRWVVRCDCGVYTLRTAKAISNPANNQDRCEHCRHLAQVKRSYHWRKTGKDKDWGEL